MAAFRPLSPCIFHPNFDFFDPDPEEDKPNSSSTPASTDVTVSDQEGRADLGEFATDRDILIQANSFLDKYTKNYQRVMNGLLPSTGHSIDLSELTEQHEATFQKLQKLLESDLKVVVQHFTSVFKTRTEAEFEGLQKLNADRFQEEVKARRKAKRETDKEMKKLDAEEQVRIIKEELSKRKVERRKRLDQETTEEISTAAPKVKMSESKIVRPSINAVMEFNFADVKVGYESEGGFVLLKNELGEESTPTFIAVNKNGDVLIGTEAKNEVNRNSLKRNSLGELIRDLGSGKKIPCFVDGQIKFVEWTVLFAVFLAKLKSDVERLEGRGFKVAALVVPLCLNFVQRTYVANAVEISGLGRPVLINDASVVALNMSVNDGIHGHLLVVITSQHHFDAAIYEVDVDAEKITFVSCIGNYHSSLPGVEAIVGDFNILKSNWLAWVLQNQIVVTKLFEDLVKPYLKSIQKVVYIDHSGINFLRGIIDMVGGKGFESKIIQSHSHTIIQNGQWYLDPLLQTWHDFTLELCPPIYPFKITDDHGMEETELLFATADTGHITSDWISLDIQPDSKSRFYVKQLGTDRGELIIPRFSGKDTPSTPDTPLQTKISANFYLLPDGRINVARVKCEIVDDTKSDAHELQPELEYLWKTKTPNRIEETDPDFKSISTIMNKEVVKEALDQLQELIFELRPLVDSVRSLIGKRLLDNGLTEAEALIAHPNSTLEKVQGKTQVLSTLIAKYLPKVV